MYINIIRGQQQIGGSIVEIGTDTTNIIFDVGVNLVENENVEIPNAGGRQSTGGPPQVGRKLASVFCPPFTVILPDL